MGRAACALLAIVCVSAVWLACTQADEAQPLPVLAEQHAVGRVLQGLVPSEVSYSLETGVNNPHIVKYKTEIKHTEKVEEEEEKEEEEDEEEGKPEKGSVGAHAAAFKKKPLKKKEPHTIQLGYTKKTTVDHKITPVLQDVMIKEKPSIVIKVTKDHAAAAAVTASKDR